MNSIRTPLLLNAGFSLLTGLPLVAAPDTVGDWLGVEASLVLRLFGIVLIGHTALLIWAAQRTDPQPLARLNFLAIAPYPILMVALVATGVIDRSLGQGLALFDGAVIAVIAGMHVKWLRTTPQIRQPQLA